MILSDGRNDLDVCFILRTERQGDPWSGQVAFPGGRADPGDTDANAVAERETWEEVGLELKAHHRIGPLPVHPIEPREQRTALTLSPFVYYVGPGAQVVATARHPEEVERVFWVPLRHLFDEAAATQLEYPVGGMPTTFPGIRFGEHVIWGLTLRVLESFAHIMRRSLPAVN